MPSDLVLASASPRRSALLEQVGARFRVVPSGVDESHPASDPGDAALAVAARKAHAVRTVEPDAWIVGADTVVVAPDGALLGKPDDREDAVGILMRLSGATHEVVTGVCVLAPDGQERQGAERTRVQMRAFDRSEAARYTASGEPLDKAGAYGIQGRGGLLVTRIEGCYFNVVGLPLSLLIRLLGALLYDVDGWLGPRIPGQE